MEKITHVIMITGIGNTMGKEFMRYYAYNPSHYVIGITRKTVCGYGFDHSCECTIDLLSKQQIDTELKPILSSIDWSYVERFTLIHSAGKSKNELPGMPIVDLDHDGIDDEMYAAQTITFSNIHEYMVSYLYHAGCLDKVKTTIVAFGSLIDKHLSPIHYSMRTLNNMMRDELRHLVDVYDTYHTVMISVSTVASATEMVYRKYADQTYWLTGAEVVDKSVDAINHWEHGYVDLPVYKRHPLYETYFKNETVEQRVQRFKKEVGMLS